jgi:hypothetical protein
VFTSFVNAGGNTLILYSSLNMRTTISVYKSLLKFLDTVDAEAEARGEGPEDKSIDAHFRSGVYLGNGVMNLILSLMPGKLQTLAELLGYKGDRQVALRFLSVPGGWTKDSAEPSVSIRKFVVLSSDNLFLTGYVYSYRGRGGPSNHLRYCTSYFPPSSIKFHFRRC